MAQIGSPATLLRPWKTLWIPALLCALALGFEAYYIFHNLDQAVQGDSVSAGREIATLTSLTREVRQKSNGTLIWQSPQNQQIIRQSDAIATMEDSEAVITFHDQSQLIVEADSLVIIEEATTLEESQSKAGGRPIIARLIKGSVKRKATGTQTGPLLVKLSDSPAAEAVTLDDDSGNAVFRLIHRGHGLEIIVESGSIRVNQGRPLKASERATVTADGKPMLPAPRLRKPKIEIEPGNEPPADTSFFRSWNLIPSAFAEEPSRQVSIQFDWEEVAGAESYLVQVSNSPDFSSVLKEEKVKATAFPYEFSSPTESMKFYFRVAAVSPDGTIGEFSDAQMIQIHPEATHRFVPEPMASSSPTPVPTPSASPVPLPSSSPLPVIKPKKSVPRLPAPAPSAPAPKSVPAIPTVSVTAPISTPAFARTSSTSHLQVSYGAQFHQRTLKSETSPRTSTGSGFVPARLAAELQLVHSDSTALTFSGNYLFETLRPELSSPGRTPLKSPIFQSWMTYGKKSGSLLLQGGLYASSSTRIRSQGLLFELEQPLLLGAVLGISTHPDTLHLIHYKARLAALGVGARGVDIALGLEQPLFKLEPVRLSETSGPFIGLEVQGRWLNLETGFSATLEAGYRLF